MNLQAKRVVLVSASVVVAAGLLITFGHKAKANQEDPPMRPAAVALVQKRSLSNSVTLSGEFRPFQEVDVHAKVAGYIRVIRVDARGYGRQRAVVACVVVLELKDVLQRADAAVRLSNDAVRRAKRDL